jgi:hypothetical protein
MDGLFDLETGVDTHYYAAPRPHVNKVINLQFNGTDFSTYFTTLTGTFTESGGLLTPAANTYNSARFNNTVAPISSEGYRDFILDLDLSSFTYGASNSIYLFASWSDTLITDASGTGKMNGLSVRFNGTGATGTFEIRDTMTNTLYTGASNYLIYGVENPTIAQPVRYLRMGVLGSKIFMAGYATQPSSTSFPWGGTTGMLRAAHFVKSYQLPYRADTQFAIAVNAGATPPVIDSLKFTPMRWPAGPDPYIETKRYSYGDFTTKKWFRELIMNRTNGSSAVSVDTVLNLDNLPTTMATNLAGTGNTWTQNAVSYTTWDKFYNAFDNWNQTLGGGYKTSKLRFSKRDRFIGFRFWNKSANQQVFEYISTNVGWKPLRGGRV